MTKQTKLITLTPTDSFFFGGEQTFGRGDGRNFYAESRFLPQQTSIVGLIRHALFEAGQQSNFGKSFVIGEENNFGWLEKISPVFIHHNDKSLGLPIRLANQENKQNGNNRTAAPEIKSVPGTKVDFGMGFQEAVVVEGYTEKSGTSYSIVFDDGSQTGYNDIFRKVIKTGIALDSEKHTHIEGMFYRQLLYRMVAGYSFGVYVTGDVELFRILDGRNMPFGGEKVNFVIKVHEEGEFTADHLKEYFPNGQIVLTSDAYVSEEIYRHCTLAVADSISFRNIVTPGNQYSARLDKNQNSTHRYKSRKFNLLKRGSVLFPKGNNGSKGITEALENQEFKKIGYNHFFSTDFKTISS